MNYVDFCAGGKEYKLRLTTRAIVQLEKQIGRNPLMIFGNGEEIPTITNMVNVLYFSLQSLQNGITLNDAYDIYDTYIADGHTTTDFIKVIIDIYRASGIIPTEEAEKN
jgi:hypothetical protein